MMIMKYVPCRYENYRCHDTTEKVYDIAIGLEIRHSFMGYAFFIRFYGKEMAIFSICR